MAVRHFVLSNADGTIQIMQIAQQPDGRWPTVAECMSKWLAPQRQAVTGSKLVNRVDIPADRTFRNAWRHDGTAFSTDMPQAREIHRTGMRKARMPLLANLDQQYLRADEGGDVIAKQAIAAQKQALRDVTADPAIDAASTPDTLKAVWPAALKT